MFNKKIKIILYTTNNKKHKCLNQYNSSGNHTFSSDVSNLFKLINYAKKKKKKEKFELNLLIVDRSLMTFKIKSPKHL